MIEVPDFLPLGSVVTLKGSPKTLMVIGRALAYETNDGSKEYYDYSLCLFPEGLVRDAVIYSNHDCVENVLFEGFSNDEDVALIKTVENILPKIEMPKANPQPVSEW